MLPDVVDIERSMIIYIVRHAVAVEREDWEKSDESRPLTREGTTKMQEAARGLSRLGLRIDRILSSPLKRARQTADILADALGVPKPELTETLEPGRPPFSVLEEIEDMDPGTSVALVGHEPDLGEMAAFLIGVERPLPFKKGAGMCIQFDGRASQGRGEMLWYMPTKVMKQIS